MPKVNDYKNKNASPKRRPGRDEGLEYVDTLKATSHDEDEASASEEDDIEVEILDADSEVAEAKSSASAKKTKASKKSKKAKVKKSVKASYEDDDSVENSAAQSSEEISDELSAPEMDEADKLHEDAEKVRIEFFGSELLRDKAPEVFEAAESIATEWKKDGDFEGIAIPNPLLKQATTLGLQKAKEVEKKLEEKGVFLVAKMGIELVKSKLKK